MNLMSKIIVAIALCFQAGACAQDTAEDVDLQIYRRLEVLRNICAEQRLAQVILKHDFLAFINSVLDSCLSQFLDTRPEKILADLHLARQLHPVLNILIGEFGDSIKKFEAVDPVFADKYHDGLAKARQILLITEPIQRRVDLGPNCVGDIPQLPVCNDIDTGALNTYQELREIFNREPTAQNAYVAGLELLSFGGLDLGYHRAKRCFRVALALEPNHMYARKMLTQICWMNGDE